MATIAVKLAVILSLFIISQAARTPFNLPANEFQTISTSSESDTNKDTATLETIRLPSEKSSGSDAIPIVKVTESDTLSIRSNMDAIDVSKPYKITYDVSFHPINRHFHHHHNNMNVKRPFWYRFPHRCGNHHGKPTVEKQVTAGREISYGNDMLMSDKKERFHGDVGQIPARLREYHGHMFSFVIKPSEVNGGSLLDKLGHVDDEEEKGHFVRRFLRKLIKNRF